MKTKKSMTGTNYVIAFVMGLAVFLVIFFIFRSRASDTNKETSYNVQSTGDYDRDGVANYFDDCKCIYGDTDNGCPPRTDLKAPDFNPYDQCPGLMGMCPPWKPDVDNCKQ